MFVFVCALGARWLPRLSTERPGEAFGLWVKSTGEALFGALMLYLFYIALEPFIRRRWPSLLIAWSRLVAGDVRNPMVGRDVMIGIIAGLLGGVLLNATEVILKHLGHADKGPELGINRSLLGMRFSIAGTLGSIVGGIEWGTVTIVLLVLLLMILRRRTLAAGAFFVVSLTGLTFALVGDWMLLPSVALAALLWTLIAARYGLLAHVVYHATLNPLANAPHISAPWSTPMMLIPYAMIALLALWAFRTSLGGQSLLREGVLGD
jgi:serine/threonine-protein kinase